MLSGVNIVSIRVKICIYRVIHEVFPPLSVGIPEVIWNKKCEYTNGMQLIMKEIQ
jgi:hypothetical protein